MLFILLFINTKYQFIEEFLYIFYNNVRIYSFFLFFKLYLKLKRNEYQKIQIKTKLVRANINYLKCLSIYMFFFLSIYIFYV